MKTIILIFCMLTSLSSCNNDSNAQDVSITGNWNFIKFENGFSPVENFKEGDIIMVFQEDGIVLINSSVDSTPIKPNGSYNYSVNGNKLTIDNEEYDYTIEKNQLIIFDDPSADGFKATFLKVDN